MAIAAYDLKKLHKATGSGHLAFLSRVATLFSEKFIVICKGIVCANANKSPFEKSN